MQAENRFDVVICGGGLAGLTLARHLRRQLPNASVALVEPTVRPLPDACFKVGESSVEVGSHFFESILGLRSYLEERHYIKNGLRFFSGDTQGPLAARTEIGPSEFPIVPSFQLDRGRLEHDLRGFIEEDGVTFFEGYSVYDIDLLPRAEQKDGKSHTVRIANKDKKLNLSATWVVDASGRRRFIQRKFDLTRDAHHDHSASWFRVTGKLDVNDLVPKNEVAWHNRDVDGNRWLSTVHLMGKGYWLWLIPLATGYHSIGIVASETHHPFETFARPEAAMEWIRKHEPAAYEKLKDLPMDDFKMLRKYAYTSTQVFSDDRWTCVGEAGVFVDPLYSPGSDFIALSNTMSTELIRHDLAGEHDPKRTEEYNHFFLNFAEVALATYRGCSHIQGAPKALVGKLYWDNWHYWSFVCQYFFNGIYKLPAADLVKFHALHEQFFELNKKSQSVLKVWAELAPGSGDGKFYSLPQFPSALATLHLDLQNRRGADETYQVMLNNLAGAKEVVAELTLRALKAAGEAQVHAFAQKTGFRSWDLAIDERRLAFETSADRATDRRNLPGVARDMERCLGRPENDGVGASMRELLEMTA